MPSELSSNPIFQLAAFLISGGIPLSAIGHVRLQQQIRHDHISGSYLLWHLMTSWVLLMGFILISSGFTVLIWNFLFGFLYVNDGKVEPWQRSQASPNDIFIELHSVLDTERYKNCQGENIEKSIVNNAFSCLNTTISFITQKKGEDQKGKKDDFVIYQKIAFKLLRHNVTGGNDKILSTTLSLLALISKNKSFRQRYITSVDNFDLQTPIRCVQQSLNRAKKLPNDSSLKSKDWVVKTNDKKIKESDILEMEELAAEVQRKACLFFGALCDGDSKLSIEVATIHAGLQTILDALDWFRYHSEVSNWGLWAIFTLCHEHISIKKELMKLGGFYVICQTMRCNLSTEKVQRHGIAIFYDILQSNVSSDLRYFAQIQKIALNAGMHEVIGEAMNKHSHSKEITMMSRDILIATRYKGLKLETK